MVLTCRDVAFLYHGRTSYLSSFIMYQTSSLFSVKLSKEEPGAIYCDGYRGILKRASKAILRLRGIPAVIG